MLRAEDDLLARVQLPGDQAPTPWEGRAVLEGRPAVEPRALHPEEDTRTRARTGDPALSNIYARGSGEACHMSGRTAGGSGACLEGEREPRGKPGGSLSGTGPLQRSFDLRGVWGLGFGEPWTWEGFFGTGRSGRARSLARPAYPPCVVPPDPQGPVWWVFPARIRFRELLRQLRGQLRGLGGHRWEEAPGRGLHCPLCGGRVDLYLSVRRGSRRPRPFRGSLALPPRGPTPQDFRRLRNGVGDCLVAMAVGLHES